MTGTMPFSRLMAAAALAAALMSYFVLVVHEAAQHGETVRLERRQASTAPAAPRPATARQAGHAEQDSTRP